MCFAVIISQTFAQKPVTIPSDCAHVKILKEDKFSIY